MFKQLILIATVLAVSPTYAKPVARPQSLTAVPESAKIEVLFKKFLAAGNRGDYSLDPAFWADELVYTNYSGKRFGKAELLKQLEGLPAPKPGESPDTFDAEDVEIHQFGKSAVLTCRLRHREEEQGKVTIRYYLNTCVFIKRDGRWQAVAWQNTLAAEPK